MHKDYQYNHRSLPLTESEQAASRHQQELAAERRINRMAKPTHTPKVFKNQCWVRACRYNSGGSCITPDKPKLEGCAATWYTTGNIPRIPEAKNE
jgi:hypothetical protein